MTKFTLPIIHPIVHLTLNQRVGLPLSYCIIFKWRFCFPFIRGEQKRAKKGAITVISLLQFSHRSDKNMIQARILESMICSMLFWVHILKNWRNYFYFLWCNWISTLPTTRPITWTDAIFEFLVEWRNSIGASNRKTSNQSRPRDMVFQ